VWRGVPKPVALLDPAAGQPVTYVPSQGEIECVRAVTFLLTTSNAVAARRAVVRFLDGQGVPVAVCASPFTLAASKSQRVSLYVGGEQFGANDAGAVGGPLYERWLDGLLTLQVTADLLAAGDKISELRLDVVGYPADWYDDADDE
jgi:hypothetical protein